MVGWLKKYHVECPRCKGLEVLVPWQPGHVQHLRRMAGLLVVLWLTTPLWVLLGANVGSVWPWSGALIAYAAISIMAFAAISRSARRFRCIACDYKWLARWG